MDCPPKKLLALFGLICCIVFTDSCFRTQNESYGHMTPDQSFLIGTNAKINCTLAKGDVWYINETFKVNCSNIQIRLNSKELKDTECLNPLTLQLTIRNGSRSDSGTYNCKVKLPIDRAPLICANIYNFGVPPLEVDNFTCVSYDYHTLNCTWKLKENKVFTRYTLEQLRGFPVPCAKNSSTSCIWRMDTDPLYYRNEDVLAFKLTGKNDLGENYTIYRLKHYEIVKAGPPMHFESIGVGSTYAEFNWTAPHYMFNFPPGIIYQLQYKSPYDKDFKVVDTVFNTYTLRIESLYANTKYNIRIRCKSSEVKSDELWSNFESLNISTKPDIPFRSPKLTRNSFEIQKSSDHLRTISIFWEPLEKWETNSENFKYVISYYPVQIVRAKRETIKENHSVTLYSANHWTFYNLSSNVDYKFVLQAENDMGSSIEHSELVVNKDEYVLQVPSQINVMYHLSGFYHISWEWHKPNNNSSNELNNFTVFWCDSLKPRPNICEGTLRWVDVLKSQKSYNWTLKETTNYQFAVAANSEHSSSGMEWATCVLPVDTILDPPSMTIIPSSRSLNISWSFDCSAKERMVKDYKIIYSKCNYKDWKPVLIPGGRKKYDLIGLDPFHCYFVKVQVRSAVGWSQESQPQSKWTDSEAPSPPYSIHMLNVTNTSLTLQWQPPRHPNGQIHYYLVHYNKEKTFSVKVESGTPFAEKYTLAKLAGHTKYNITIQACVDEKKCSEYSHPHYFTTNIGVPGPIEPPSTSTVNASFVKVFWKPPLQPNGPIDFYLLHVFQLDENNDTRSEIYNVTGNETSTLVSINCNFNEGDRSRYFGVQAVNFVEDNKGLEMLYSKLSGLTETAMCFSNREEAAVFMIIGITVGSALGLLILVFALYALTRWMRETISEMKEIKAELPDGLKTPCTQSSYDHFKNGSIQRGSSPKPEMTRLNSYTSEEGFNKNRHGSGTSQFSATSTDELLTKEGKPSEKSCRNPSGDSVPEGRDSLSSSLTHRTNLSSDSGNEADLNNPPSPEILKENDHSSSDDQKNSSSKDSGLEKEDEEQASTSPYSQLAGGSSPIESPKEPFLPPYCKMGLEQSCYVPFSRGGRNMPFIGLNLASSEPNIAEALAVTPTMDPALPLSPQALPDSDVFNYSKFGLSRSINNFQDVLLEPLESTSNNHLGEDVLPYSRFGMRRLNSPTVKDPFVGMAFSFTPNNPQDLFPKQNQWQPVLHGQNGRIKNKPFTPRTVKSSGYIPVEALIAQGTRGELDENYSKFGLAPPTYQELLETRNSSPKPSTSGYVSVNDVQLLPAPKGVVVSPQNDEESYVKAHEINLPKEPLVLPVLDLGDSSDYLVLSEQLQAKEPLPVATVSPVFNSTLLGCSVTPKKAVSFESPKLVDGSVSSPPPELPSPLKKAAINGNVNGYVSHESLAKISSPTNNASIIPKKSVDDSKLKRSNGYVALGELPSTDTKDRLHLTVSNV